MDQLRIQITAPDRGWPYNVDVEAGGYSEPLVVVAADLMVPWGRLQVGHRVHNLVDAWVQGGAISCAAEWSRLARLDSAKERRYYR